MIHRMRGQRLKYAAAFARAGSGRVILFSVQPAHVPPNLMTLPERILEDRRIAGCCNCASKCSALLSDPLFDGLELSR
jgi:hypothetical protein